MATLNVGSLGEYIREQREQAEVSLRQLAKVAGVSNPYLSQIERGLRKPSAEILQQIANGLRISAETLYVRAGILEERDGDPAVAAAILADGVLTERQKRALLDVYESFRRENHAIPAVAARRVVKKATATRAATRATAKRATARKAGTAAKPSAAVKTRTARARTR
ncbi:MAG TPA: helix-turn-helix transcriptional regulator [Actinomycetes bacterium]